ncbi:MAG: SIR2 family protein [Gemmatimonadota bacterium]|nr:SIR2 family protein [Gemmatimonadota bacterium]
MLLVIFGAGASYDSAPQLRPSRDAEANVQWRPPLTDMLFAERKEFGRDITNYPRILPLVAQLSRASKDQPLEKMLARLVEEASDYPARLSELVAVRYYLQQLIWECDYRWQYERLGITNYLGILDRIQRWRHGRRDSVLFLTFNYDRLFEYAASFYISDGKKPFANEYSTLESYIDQPYFPLVKLHGSIDWGYRVNTDLPIVAESGEHVWSIAHEVIARFTDLSIATEITKTEERPPKPQGGHAYVPALAIPLDKKSNFACPESHLEFLDSRLHEVRSVLAIGWRGMEEHFLGRISGELAADVRLLTVCGSREASDETVERLRSAGIGRERSEPFEGGFSEFVPSAEADAFLKEALAAE